MEGNAANTGKMSFGGLGLGSTDIYREAVFAVLVLA
jgi:hypothetical protein